MKRILPIFLLALSFLMAPVVQASVSVGPSRVVLKMNAGEKESGFYTVQNKGDAKLKVNVEPVDWAYGVEGEREPIDWLSVDPKEFVLKPGEEKKVRYRVKTNKSDTGEKRTQVFFVSQPLGGESPLVSRLGTIVYVAIEGTEILEASIVGVKVDSLSSVPEVDKPDKLRFDVSILNLGNCHIVPEGRVVIKNDAGRSVDQIKITGGWGLLPQETHGYQALKAGIYLKPGDYTADVLIFYGGDLNKRRKAEKTVHFRVNEAGEAALYDPETELTPESPAGS